MLGIAYAWHYYRDNNSGSLVQTNTITPTQIKIKETEKQKPKQSDKKKTKPTKKIANKTKKAYSPPSFGAQMVTITSNITHKDLGYKKIGTHYPSDFIIRINDQILVYLDGKEVINKPLSVKLNDNKLSARYDYKFGSYKKGAKIIHFKVDQQIKNIDLSFEWKNECRLIISHATPTSHELATFTNIKSY